MLNSPETLQIDTPENVRFGYTVAGIGSRFLAALLDNVLIVFLQGGAVFLAVVLFRYLPEDLLSQDSTLEAWIIGAVVLLVFAISWVYYIAFEMLWNGQSPGKRWAGVRVIRADGTPITLSESLIRNLVRTIDVLPYFYGVGTLTMFLTRPPRRLGDLAAGTLVVQDGQMPQLSNLESDATTIAGAGERVDEQVLDADTTQPAPAILHVSPAAFNLAEEYLQRRFEIIAGRETLCEQIAAVLHEQLKQPGDAPLWPACEDYLESLVLSRTRHS